MSPKIETKVIKPAAKPAAAKPAAAKPAAAKPAAAKPAAAKKATGPSATALTKTLLAQVWGKDFGVPGVTFQGKVPQSTEVGDLAEFLLRQTHAAVGAKTLAYWRGYVTGVARELGLSPALKKPAAAKPAAAKPAAAKPAAAKPAAAKPAAAKPAAAKPATKTVSGLWSGPKADVAGKPTKKTSTLLG